MHIFLSALDDIPDPRAGNARHDLGELLVIAFVSVLCDATSCAEMSAFGRAKESIFRDFLKLKHAIPSHDTFSVVFRMIDPKALDAAFGQVLADVAALLREGDVVAIDGNLPENLPRIEQVVEPESLVCPCGCGVAIVARTNGATMTTAQDR